jgi:predicted phosphodiesterase
MKIAVISDIHSNLQALQAVLEDIDRERATVTVQLGDLVGYNADPEECVDLIRQREAISIQGNHDRAAARLEFAEGFNILAYQAVVWAANSLRPEQKQFLAELPDTKVLWDRYLLFHGAPENPDAYLYYLFQAKKAFNYMRSKVPGIRIAFFGHTHRRIVWQRDVRGKVSALEIDRESLSLDAEQLYLINPGSVGQPRENNWQASYLIFSTEPEEIRFKSIPYDLAAAQAKIRQARLPEYLAERLAAGV